MTVPSEHVASFVLPVNISFLYNLVRAGIHADCSIDFLGYKDNPILDYCHKTSGLNVFERIINLSIAYTQNKEFELGAFVGIIRKTKNLGAILKIENSSLKYISPIDVPRCCGCSRAIRSGDALIFKKNGIDSFITMKCLKKMTSHLEDATYYIYSLLNKILYKYKFNNVGFPYLENKHPCALLKDVLEIYLQNCGSPTTVSHLILNNSTGKSIIPSDISLSMANSIMDYQQKRNPNWPKYALEVVVLENMEWLKKVVQINLEKLLFNDLAQVSQWQGKAGNRITDSFYILSAKEISTKNKNIPTFVKTRAYTMIDKNDNVYVWFSSTRSYVPMHEWIVAEGDIKAHTTFNGCKQTQIEKLTFINYGYLYSKYKKLTLNVLRQECVNANIAYSDKDTRRILYEKLTQQELDKLSVGKHSDLL
jgi:hypothetical protein